jgi:hypothetical protein
VVAASRAGVVPPYPGAWRVHTPVAPHWVHNGPAISLSVTVTYFTAATERENMIEACNARLRRLHLAPRPPGLSVPVDTAKVTAMRVRGLARSVRSGIGARTTRKAS